jgi:hypothetical protein
MGIEDVVSLVLAVAALTALGVVVGAVIMWRLVHMKANPPPLPAWVHAVELTALSLFGISAWIAGQWLTVIGIALLIALAIIQLVASVRARPWRTDE